MGAVAMHVDSLSPADTRSGHSVSWIAIAMGRSATEEVTTSAHASVDAAVAASTVAVSRRRVKPASTLLAAALAPVAVCHEFGHDLGASPSTEPRLQQSLQSAGAAAHLYRRCGHRKHVETEALQTWSFRLEFEGFVLGVAYSMPPS